MYVYPSDTISMCDTLMVVAIDLGTTFSGYAFSTTAEFKDNPLTFHANQVCKTGSCSLKFPTCILFDQNKTCDSFGYQAEDRYTDVVLEKSENQYFFFKHFKMKISTQKVRLSADRYNFHFVYVSI